MEYRTALLFIIFGISILMTVVFSVFARRNNYKAFDYKSLIFVGVGWSILGFLFYIWLLIIIGLMMTTAGYLFWRESVKERNPLKKREINNEKTKKRADCIDTLCIALILISILVLTGIIFYVFFTALS